MADGELVIPRGHSPDALEPAIPHPAARRCLCVRGRTRAVTAKRQRDPLYLRALPALALRHRCRREHHPDPRQVTRNGACTIPIIRVSAGDSVVIIAASCGTT